MRPSPPSVLLALLAILVCGSIALFLRDPPVSEGLAAPVIDTVEARAPSDPPAASAVAVEARSRLGEGREEIADGPQPLEAGGKTLAELDGHLVRGTLVLLDGEDLELPPADGHFEVLSRTGEVPAKVSVEVTAGRFTLRLPDPEVCVVSSIHLADGRRAALVAEYGGELLSGPLEDLRLIVVARPLAEVTLVVVDAATRAHLSGIELRQAYDLEDQGALHPGAPQAYAKRRLGLSSPISVTADDPDWATATTCWVHARGYGWADVQVDHVRGGEYLVALEPGGSLRLEIVGLTPLITGKAPVLVRMRRGEARAPVIEAALGAERILEWSGVPPGELRATLEVGDWWDDVGVLGEAVVSIVAGEQTDVVLAVTSDLTAPGRVPCSGSVRVGAYWREQGFNLRFVPSGETERWADRILYLQHSELAADPTDPELLNWELTLPAAGTWQLGFAATALHIDFEAAPPVTTGVDLVVPDPAELRISAVDAITGEPIDALGVDWRVAGSSFPQGVVWTPPQFDEERGIHTLIIPAGRIELSLQAEGYAETDAEEVDLPPGVTEREWLFERVAGGLRFLFEDGETAVPTNFFEWEVEAEALDGEGELDWLSEDTVSFTAPGRYRIVFTGIAGYRPVEVEAEVPFEGVDWVRIALEKE
jgi:hypothetical protein